MLACNKHTGITDLQVTRIRREEALLCRDEQYLRYTQRVRWRLVPGVWWASSVLKIVA